MKIGLSILLSLMIGTILFFSIKSNSLSYSEYEQLVDKKENFYFVLSKKNCSDCIEFNKYLKSGENIYEVELSKNKRLDEWRTFIQENDVKLVPSLYEVRDGKVTKIQGEGSAKKLYNNYKKMEKY